MKKIFILAIILLSGTAAASAQEFLTINPDVRTAGMANASVATTGGAYSVFQNAASNLGVLPPLFPDNPFSMPS